MPTDTPSYLRLHRPSAGQSATGSPSGISDSSAAELAQQFWSVFASATGWRIDSHAARRENKIQLIPAIETPSLIEGIDGFDEADDSMTSDFSSVLDRENATKVASAASDLIARMRSTHAAIDRVGTRLAVEAWAIAAPESCELATSIDAATDRIQRHLSDAVAATGTTVALLSMLDDDTESLSTAATFGLPESAMNAEPRSLRGSRGDLEAMVNHVVMADQFRGGGIDSWNAPLSADGAYESGICVAIHHDDLPIGTLWLLSHEPQAFTPAHAASARLVASAIENDLKSLAHRLAPEPAAKTTPKILADISDLDELLAPLDELIEPADSEIRDLEQETASLEILDLEEPDFTNVDLCQTRIEESDFAEPDFAKVDVLRGMPSAVPIATAPTPAALAELEIGMFQQNLLPHASALATDWFADGMIESPRDYATGFHAWDVLPDGTLMVAIAQSEHETLDGALISTIARGAMASHAAYRHGVDDMLRRISDTLWQTGMIESPISMLYGHVDPNDGSGKIALAGNLRAIVANRYGYRPLAASDGSPIGIHIDCPMKMFDFQLQQDETMIGYGPGWASDGINQQTIGSALQDAIRSGTKHPLAGFRKSVAENRLGHERGAVSLTRF